MLTPAITDKSRWWTYEDLLLILLVGALFYLPGLGQVALFDRDEPRFAAAGRNMVWTGDYLIPRFNGQLRPDKPPLLYWEMALTYNLFGFNELGARMPSAVMGICTLVVVYFITGSRFGRLTGLLAALMLSATVLFVAESRLATADATMIFFTTLALGCAWRAWDVGNPGVGHVSAKPTSLPPSRHSLESISNRPARVPLGVALAFWIALALGTLTKGVPLLFVLLPMLTLSVATSPVWRRWREFSLGERLYHLPAFFLRAIFRGNWRWWRGLRPGIGIPLLLMVVGAWVGAVLTTQAGRDLLYGMFRQQYDRVLSQGTVTTYKKPFGFYFALVWVTFWPWTPLLVPAAYHTIKRLRGKTAIAFDPRPYQFILAWIIPSWIIYEIIRSKLVHYVLPLYIPMVILCADTLVQSWHRLSDVLQPAWFRAARWVCLLIWLGMAGVVLVGIRLFLPEREAEVLFWLAMPFAGALAGVGVAGAIAWNRPAWPYVTVLGFGAALLLGNSIVMPTINEFQISKYLMADAREWRDRGFALAAAGFQEPTLVFYARQPVLTMRESPLDPVFQKYWQVEEGTGKPAHPLVMIADVEAMETLDRAKVPYFVIQQYVGFRTDRVDIIRQWFAGFFGNQAKPGDQPFRVALISNLDVFHDENASTSTAAATASQPSLP